MLKKVKMLFPSSVLQMPTIIFWRITKTIARILTISVNNIRIKAAYIKDDISIPLESLDFLEKIEVKKKYTNTH